MKPSRCWTGYCVVGTRALVCRCWTRKRVPRPDCQIRMAVQLQDQGLPFLRQSQGRGRQPLSGGEAPSRRVSSSRGHRAHQNGTAQALPFRPPALARDGPPHPAGALPLDASADRLSSQPARATRQTASRRHFSLSDVRKGTQSSPALAPPGDAPTAHSGSRASGTWKACTTSCARPSSSPW